MNCFDPSCQIFRTALVGGLLLDESCVSRTLFHSHLRFIKVPCILVLQKSSVKINTQLSHATPFKVQKLRGFDPHAGTRQALVSLLAQGGGEAPRKGMVWASLLLHWSWMRSFWQDSMLSWRGWRYTCSNNNTIVHNIRIYLYIIYPFSDCNYIFNLCQNETISNHY